MYSTSVTSITAILSVLNNPRGMHLKTLSPDEVCARLRKIGYSRSNSVKLYGEVLELVSDPYPDGEDYIVETSSQGATKNRLVRIPKFIVHSARAA
jgi:hypothetical protein